MKLSICLAAAVTDVVEVVVVVVVRCHVSWRRAKWERDKLVPPKDATHSAVGGTVVLRTWVPRSVGTSCTRGGGGVVGVHGPTPRQSSLRQMEPQTPKNET